MDVFKINDDDFKHGANVFRTLAVTYRDEFLSGIDQLQQGGWTVGVLVRRSQSLDDAWNHFVTDQSTLGHQLLLCCLVRVRLASQSRHVYQLRAGRRCILCCLLFSKQWTKKIIIIIIKQIHPKIQVQINTHIHITTYRYSYVYTVQIHVLIKIRYLYRYTYRKMYRYS